MTDALARFGADLAAASRDFDGPELALAVAEDLAPLVAEQAPVVSGFLAGSVYADEAGVGVGAVYAGVVHDSNPYAERAVEAFDPGEAAQRFIDAALDDHLQSLYL